MVALGAAVAVGCLVFALSAQAGPRPNRAEYEAFRARHPKVLDPNYLPFMTWPLEVGGDELEVFCHWRPEDFPLPVHVAPPPPELVAETDEIRPPPPGAFVMAVMRALAIWHRDLDGMVSFQAVDDPAKARLRIALLGEPAEAHADKAVLGTARIGGGCEALSDVTDDGQLVVRFDVSDLRIHIADEHGLLLPDQVEKVALHEIGHALGMPAHSPIPADLMYAVARDRIPRDGLGAQDVNSFLSLYAMPSGTVYRGPGGDVEPESGPLQPKGPPRLSLAPHVDVGLGFEIQTPRGWTRVPTPYGVVAVDGVTWDFESSIQVVVRRFEGLDAYLERHGPVHLADSSVRELTDLTLAGRPAKHMVLETRRETIEELTFVESGDGRVMVLIAEAPAETYDAWAPWFLATRESLEVTGAEGNRDYRER